MLKDKGCCPMCGVEVPRLIANLRGRMREIYTCPDHGAIAYGAQAVTAQEWNDLHRVPFVEQAASPPRAVLVGVDVL